jgi:hypothetical protein
LGCLLLLSTVLGGLLRVLQPVQLQVRVCGLLRRVRLRFVLSRYPERRNFLALDLLVKKSCSKKYWGPFFLVRELR